MRPFEMQTLAAPRERTLSDYLAALERKSLLRFITCGSVDDGKSTLIGRLLYDSKMICDDQLAALKSDSKRHGTNGAKLDFEWFSTYFKHPIGVCHRGYCRLIIKR